MTDRHHVYSHGSSLPSRHSAWVWLHHAYTCQLLCKLFIGFQEMEGRGWPEESCPDANLPNLGVPLVALNTPQSPRAQNSQQCAFRGDDENEASGLGWRAAGSGTVSFGACGVAVSHQHEGFYRDGVRQTQVSCAWASSDCGIWTLCRGGLRRHGTQGDLGLNLPSS